MGLDITAYSKLSLVEAVSLKKMQETNWEHPLRYKDNRPYLFENWEPARLPPLVEGFYRCDGETHGFRAGSYSGYSAWCNVLATVAPPDDPAAFLELVEFSDCEGAMGPAVARKLHDDFTRHLDRAATVMTDTWDLERYMHWMRAFELAADGGAVHFH